MQDKFLIEVQKCLGKAQELYDIDLSEVIVKLDIQGYTIAGQAVYSKNKFIIRFHPEFVKYHYHKMVEETIPHEVAHILCMIDPELGNGHDYGWKQVCKSLGGKAKTRHDLAIPGKPERWYKSNLGHYVDLGLIRHNKLQCGKVEFYTLTKGRGTVTASDYIGE